MKHRCRAVPVVLVSFMSACAHHVEFPEVSRAEVQQAASAITKRPEDAIKMRDVRGSSYDVNAASPMVIDAQAMTLGDIASRCARNASPLTCPDADPRSPSRSPPEIDVSHLYNLEVKSMRPDWPIVFAGAVLAGAVGLNVGCFETWCGKTGRGVVIGVDIAVVALGVAGGLMFLSSLGGIH